ncbi:MAG: HAD hydrolase-like protein [Lachnospiraceae bacterium]|nr:HAD hydrolase-like protein [Lachnospiraceae bacterium]
MKYVLFDLDGTITDPKVGITKSVQYALKQFGIEVTDLDSLCPFIGPPLYQSFENFFGFSHDQALKAVEQYRVYYRDTGIFECTVYEGIPGLLKELHENGVIVMLATSKPEEYAIRLLKHFKIDEYFDLVAGSTMSGSRIEKEDIIKYAMEQATGADEINAFDVTQAYMVGDRKFDYIGAVKFGMPCILIGYGYGELEELKACAPYAIKMTVKELSEFLLNEMKHTDVK